jgi:ubiquinone/menaquinone biosynthesis C-methylase UbiE
MWEKYVRIPNWLSISRNAVNDTIFSLRLPKFSKALDVGCGYGRISLFLNENSFDVTAIDSFQQMVDKIKCKGITAMRMDAKNLKFKDKTFDLVFSDGLLEHFKSEQDVVKIIKEQLRVSKRYVLNFIPADNLVNVVFEKMQRVPKEYRDHDWPRLHATAADGTKYKITVKKMFRLNAYIIEKL